MDGHVTETSHSDSQPRLWMTSGRLVSAKSAKMTRRSEWMPRWEKFFEKALRASSSQNRICEGVELEEEDAPERIGFWDGVDLRLGAIDTTNVNEKRGRERETIKKVPTHFKYNKYIEKRVCMHEHVTCNIKGIMDSAQSNSTSTQSICTHLNAW